MATQKKIKYEESSMELQMTPMIDVVFQLIIFFMCSIHFKSLEGKLYSYLPRDKGMNPTPKTAPPIDDVRIKLVYSEDAPLLTRIKVGSNEFPDWDSLERHIRNISSSLVTPDGLEIIPVKIDADGRIPAQSVVSVLNICKKAGVQKTEIAAKTSPSPPLKK
ncbi:MAG: biopolymer transporter ExbD [Planctomycetota bacterium]